MKVHLEFKGFVPVDIPDECRNDPEALVDAVNKAWIELSETRIALGAEFVEHTIVEKPESS